jgi:chromosome segregation ATPase
MSQDRSQDRDRAQEKGQEVQQWLGEIRGLQQKLAEVQQERDQAYGSAANWRSLYETEAKQRRSEAIAAREAIDALKTELAALQRPSPDANRYSEVLRSQVEQTESLEELRLKLMQALAERDQFQQSLEEEQQAHSQTRQDLTTALGDTMDLLTKARAGQGPESRPKVVPLRPPTTPEPPDRPKSPSPERPQPDLPQFRS